MGLVHLDLNDLRQFEVYFDQMRDPSLEEDLDSLLKAQLIAQHKLNIDNHGIFAIENLAISSPKIFKMKKFAFKPLKGKGSWTKLNFCFIIERSLDLFFELIDNSFYLVDKVKR